MEKCGKEKTPGRHVSSNLLFLAVAFFVSSWSRRRQQAWSAVFVFFSSSKAWRPEG
jgi:hypothetical protein